MRVSNQVDARIGLWNAGYEAASTVARSDYLCLLRALSQSTVVTQPQPPHCTLVRLLSTYRRLPAGFTAPGSVNRALGANELAEDAHLHSTKLPIDLVGQQESTFRADRSYKWPYRVVSARKRPLTHVA